MHKRAPEPGFFQDASKELTILDLNDFLHWNGRDELREFPETFLFTSENKNVLDQKEQLCHIHHADPHSNSKRKNKQIHSSPPESSIIVNFSSVYCIGTPCASASWNTVHQPGFLLVLVHLGNTGAYFWPNESKNTNGSFFFPKPCYLFKHWHQGCFK